MSELMDEAVIRMPFDMAMESELSRKQFYDRANSALSELIELRAYKEATEKQEPVYFWKEIGETDWMECGKDWYWKCVDSPEHDTKLLYANPVPADNPVTRQDVIDVLLSTRGQSEGVTADAILGLPSDKVTVPADKPERITDEMISRAMGVVIGYSGDYGTYNDYLSKEAAREVLEAALSVSGQVPAVSVPDLPHGFNHSAYNRHTGEWVYLNHANTWQMFQGPIAAAPSHSQQSAPTVPADYRLLAEKLITKACFDAVERLDEIAPGRGWDSGETVAEMYILQLRALSGPSHESEQGGKQIIWSGGRVGNAE